MPNWTTNLLSVYGTSKDIKSVVEVFFNYFQETRVDAVKQFEIDNCSLRVKITTAWGTCEEQMDKMYADFPNIYIGMISIFDGREGTCEKEWGSYNVKDDDFKNWVNCYAVKDFDDRKLQDTNHKIIKAICSIDCPYNWDILQIYHIDLLKNDAFLKAVYNTGNNYKLLYGRNKKGEYVFVKGDDGKSIKMKKIALTGKRLLDFIKHN